MSSIFMNLMDQFYGIEDISNLLLAPALIEETDMDD